eukprot:COSAG05_NODE_20024_length_284_cov_0.816216_1_plen_39_part_10
MARTRAQWGRELTWLIFRKETSSSFRLLRWFAFTFMTWY